MGRDEQEAEAQLDDEALEVRWAQYFMSFGMEKSAPFFTTRRSQCNSVATKALEVGSLTVL